MAVMSRRSLPSIAATIFLAALAGLVDALAYLNLGGFFASFMSGNTTRLGVALGGGLFVDARTAGALILAFLSGVMFATMIAERFPDAHRAAVMLMVTALLAITALTAPMTYTELPLLLLAIAMGAENGVFNREGGTAIGLTYVTGALVAFGQRLTGALIGQGDRFGWVAPMVLWVGFVAGAALGARLYATTGTGALWLAAAGAAVLTVALALTVPARRRRPG
jgi:uncharacterized membrane protein YoaK (UPF0700 family)